MKTEWLRALEVVSEERSLNRAATRLRLSQPSLSRQIQALEQEVGTPLLDRESNGVHLTAAGVVFVRGAREVLGRLERASAEARRLARGEQRELRVGYLQSAAQSIVAPALREVRRGHREVRVVLRDLSPGEQIEALRRGELDAALVGPEGQVLAKEFYTRNLEDIPVLAAVPEDHALGARKQIGLEELAAETFVDFPEDHMPGRRRWLTGLCRKAGFKPRFGPKAEGVGHLLALLVSEPAVTLLPAFIREYPHPGVALVRLRPPAPVWPLLLVWRRGRTTTELRALIDALARQSVCKGDNGC